MSAHIIGQRRAWLARPPNDRQAVLTEGHPSAARCRPRDRPRRPRPAPRLASWMLVPLFASLLSVGCGDGAPDPASNGDGWPVGSPIDTVLAYVALAPGGDELTRVFDRFVGWRPAGLSDERMAVLAVLDASVLGGFLGLALPVADADAFRASLAECPSIAFEDADRFVVTLSPDSELLTAVRIARATLGGGGFVQRLAAMGQPVSTTSTWDLSFSLGQALLVPSFEASFVLRKLLETLPLGVDADSPTAVVSIDNERIEMTYYEEIQKSRRQLDALLSGDPEAGAAGTLGQLLDGGGSESPRLGGLPFDGATIAALLEMLAIDSLGAAQLQVSAGSLLRGLVSGGEPAPPGRDDARLTMRLRWAEASPLSEVFSALRPAPARPAASQHGALSADADRFAGAFAEWMRPLVEVVHGEGARADSAVAELAVLLHPWGGHLIARIDEDEPVCVATLRPGERLDGAALIAWFGPIVAALDGSAGGQRSADGQQDDEAHTGVVRDRGERRERFHDDDDGSPGLPFSSWSLDDLLVISSGDEDQLALEAALDDARAARGAPVPESGPSLVLQWQDGVITLEVTDGTLEIVADPAPADQETR